jgi:hypothetical protein
MDLYIKKEGNNYVVYHGALKLNSFVSDVDAEIFMRKYRLDYEEAVETEA